MLNITFSDEEEGNNQFNEVARRRARPRFRERISWDEFGESVFKENFRCTPATADALLAIIGNDIRAIAPRNHALTAKERLCIALRFLADDDDYHAIASAEHCCKATVCQMVRRVCGAIIRHLGHIINWPNGNAERRAIADAFFAYARPGIPNVCGCVDGSLIPIQAPSRDEPQFVDRHGIHSINAMAVAGPNLLFYSFSCRWPGSLHDARVLAESGLYQKFEDGFRPFANAIILGDSAYPQLDWLVPMRRVIPERFGRLYNSHPKTRRAIECAWGLYKVPLLKL